MAFPGLEFSFLAKFFKRLSLFEEMIIPGFQEEREILEPTRKGKSSRSRKKAEPSGSTKIFWASFWGSKWGSKSLKIRFTLRFPSASRKPTPPKPTAPKPTAPKPTAHTPTAHSPFTYKTPFSPKTPFKILRPQRALCPKTPSNQENPYPPEMVSLAQEISPLRKSPRRKSLHSGKLFTQEISPQEISPPGNLSTQKISIPTQNPYSINQMPLGPQNQMPLEPQKPGPRKVQVKGFRSKINTQRP